MSKALEQFKKSYKNLHEHCTKLEAALLKSHPQLFNEMRLNPEDCNFSESQWANLSSKTLNEFKAAGLWKKINKELRPLMPQPLNVAEPPGTEGSTQLTSTTGDPTSSEQIQDMESRSLSLNVQNKHFSFNKLTSSQITQVLDSIKDLVEEVIQDVKDHKSSLEIFLDFLKSCINLIITFVTFGKEQNFFKKSSFHLEQIKKTQQETHTLFDKLSDEEKEKELEINNLQSFSL